MMDFKDLRAFVRVADLKGISAAARSLKAPKSSVSRSLSRLEEDVSTVLVERSTRHLRLTDAGRLLYRHALRVLHDVEEAETALGLLSGVPRGTVRVGATYAVTQLLVAPMLPRFLAAYPEVRVVLDADNRRTDMLAEELDLMIRVGRLPDSELIARRLATLELWACASPSYLAERGAPDSLDDLAAHDTVGQYEQTRWTFWTEAGKKVTTEVAPRAVLQEPAAAHAAVEGGAGIGMLPDYIAASAVASGRLVRVLPHLRPQTVDVHALYPSRRSLSAKVRVFIDALTAHVASAQSATPADEPPVDLPSP